jgi:hypothetical protein
MNKTCFTFFPCRGFACSARRSLRSPAAFSDFSVIWSAMRAPRHWSGQRAESPAPFPRKKGKALRSNKGGANAV